MLPAGALGLLTAAMLAAFISTHDTYLHSWGTIFVQDVLLPFREKPLSPRAHLWALRASILGVALFIFCFSILIKPTQFIAMFFAITGAIFAGGSGAVIIGGLYWKRGTVRHEQARFDRGRVAVVDEGLPHDAVQDRACPGLDIAGTQHRIDKSQPHTAVRPND